MGCVVSARMTGTRARARLGGFCTQGRGGCVSSWGGQDQPWNPERRPFFLRHPAVQTLGIFRGGDPRPRPPARVGEGRSPTSAGKWGRGRPSRPPWSLQQPLSSVADVGFPGDRGGGSAWWGRTRRRACAAGVAPPPDKISPEA